MDFLVLPVLIGLTVVAFGVNHLAKDESGSTKTNSTPSKAEEEKQQKYSILKRKFFAAYFLAIFGDWLQGPYVYQLYSSYGFQENQIAILFLAGFASSSSFGTLTGPLADKYGRKRMAMVFAILYGICCCIKISSSFWVLLSGRLLGGISTSLLFSVFESWYVKEHLDVHRLNPDWLSQTFSTTTFANGIMAILAGIVANFFSETLAYGPLAPFMIAIPCFGICFIVVLTTWDENFGNQDTHLIQSYKEGLQLIWKSPMIMTLGLVQSIIESCMYIFVFLWTPVLTNGSASAPLGLIFSSFMVAIMIGSSTFSLLLAKHSKKPRDTLWLAASIFASSTLISTLAATPNATSVTRLICFLTFLVLEFSIGIYFPSIGCLRSAHIPESHRATVTNWYRVPMNLITCFTLLAVNHPVVASDKRLIFGACTVLLGFGVLLASRFRRLELVKGEEKKD